MKWIKASEFKWKPIATYYALRHDEIIPIKSTGFFQESDGTFFWNEKGFVPVLKERQHELYILDESPNEEEGWEREIYDWCMEKVDEYRKEGGEKIKAIAHLRVICMLPEGRVAKNIKIEGVEIKLPQPKGNK